MNGYELSKNWFNWAFENPEKTSPGHTAIYFFAIEQCNRMGWKEKFGFPSQLVMEAVGIKKHDTYSKYFNDLVEWGFIVLIEKSKNQFSANIISLLNAIPKNGSATGLALGAAMGRHVGEQLVEQGDSTRVSTGVGDGYIIKQENNKPKNNKPKTVAPIFENGEVVKFKSNLDNVDYKGLEKQVKTWLTYKETEKKDCYKTSQSSQVMINQLEKLSNGNPEKANEIVEYSIANHYKGLFAPSQNNWKSASAPQQSINSPVKHKVEYYNTRWPDNVKICTEEQFEQIRQGNPEESFVVVRKFK
jgi:hypothetical protein